MYCSLLHRAGSCNFNQSHDEALPVAHSRAASRSSAQSSTGLLGQEHMMSVTLRENTHVSKPVVPPSKTMGYSPGYLFVMGRCHNGSLWKYPLHELKANFATFFELFLKFILAFEAGGLIRCGEQCSRAPFFTRGRVRASDKHYGAEGGGRGVGSFITPSPPSSTQ